jgi:dipeptidyl aminopeptidase/acylaminoacyl peptidase
MIEVTPVLGLQRRFAAIRAYVIAVLACCLALDHGNASAADLIPVEHFTRNPPLINIRFSPDGTKFAALTIVNGRRNLAVADVAKSETRVISSYSTADVQNFAWISDKRIVFSLTDLQAGLGEQDGGGLFAVDDDGKDGRQLSVTGKNCAEQYQFFCRTTSFWSRVPGSEDEIFAVNNERSLLSPDLVRLDTRTGRKVIVSTDNPGNVYYWVLDRQQVPRAAMSQEPKTLNRIFWYRDSATTPWRAVSRFRQLQPGITPLGFAPDGTLYVASNVASGDKEEIFTFDPKTDQPGQRLARHPDFDLGLIESDDSFGPPGSPLLFDRKTNELIGLSVEGDRPETIWLDEKFARVQATVDASLPKGNVNELRRLNATNYVIRTHSGSYPDTYFTFDETKRELREILRPLNWIKPEQMAPVTPIRYKARDGLVIPAYLTLPAKTEARNLPLVVWVHGGPWARDELRFDREVQFLASRGYAVLQPNYRGSTGFGLKHMQASFKQLGQTMQDDVTDGVRKLIADGTVDAKRVCIGGGSYGGYATMMGLVREPTLFKCGIDVVGVVDLFWWIDLGYTDFNNFLSSDEAGQYLRLTIGDPSVDRAMMEANSPRYQAARIKAPVIIISGANDRRVPIKHAEGMRSALRAAGNEPEWVVFPEEGHGFRKESNRVTYYKAMEAFLAKHIGAGAAP